MINIMIKAFIIAAMLLTCCACDVMAQHIMYADRCNVSVMDVTGIKTSDLENDTAPKRGFKELGTFDTVVHEEELTTKSFRLPNTKLYIVASAWYTDESMAGGNSRDSISLQLTISPTAKRDILSGLQFAEAEVPSKNFEVARVTTIYKLGRRSFYIVMECRKHTRP
jgi:hypothetical protein